MIQTALLLFIFQLLLPNIHASENFTLSPKCVDAIYNVKDPLTILKSADAWGKPVGILEGSFISFGDYEECVKIRTKPQVQGDKSVSFGYAMLEGKLSVGISGKINILPVLLGVCVPSDCMGDLVHMIDILHKPSTKISDLLHENKYMTRLHEVMHPVLNMATGVSFKLEIKAAQPAEPTEWSGGDVAYVCICVAILLLVLIATYIDYVHKSEMFNRRHSSRQLLKIDEEDPDLLQESTLIEDEQDPKQPLISNHSQQTVDQPGDRVRKSTIAQIIECFSLYQTVPNLFKSAPSSSPELNVLNTIRAISMWWVVIGHVCSIFIEPEPLDTLGLLERSKEFRIVLIFNAFLSVDSFFFLSAFLLTYITFKTNGMAKFNYIRFVVLRYLRLTFTYAVVMFGWFLLNPHLGEGPLWYRNQETSTKRCLSNWWTNLLYINEFYPEFMEDSCMAWSWYLAVDFHLYMVSPIFLYALYKYRGWFGKYSVFVVAFIAIGITTIWTSIYFHVPAIPTPVAGQATMADKNLEFRNWLSKFYQKPWNHLTVFMIGILAGYWALKRRQLIASGKARPWRYFVITGVQLLGIALMLTALFLPYNFIHNLSRWSNVGNAFYNYFSRIVWSLGLALFTFVTIVQPESTHLLTLFWSWSGWAILARLTYGVYLLHIIVYRLVAGARLRALPFDGIQVTQDIGGCLFWSYILASLLYVTVEDPCANMVKMLVRRRK